MPSHPTRHIEVPLLPGRHRNIRGLDRPPPTGGGLRQTPSPATEPTSDENVGEANSIQLLRHLDTRQKPPHCRCTLSRPGIWPMRPFIRSRASGALTKMDPSLDDGYMEAMHLVRSGKNATHIDKASKAYAS